MARTKAGPKGGARSGQVSAKDHVHEEDHIDGCDFDFVESEATSDAELPASRGGVEEAKRKRQTRRP
jgi:hypothetical protein